MCYTLWKEFSRLIRTGILWSSYCYRLHFEDEETRLVGDRSRTGKDGSVWSESLWLTPLVCLCSCRLIGLTSMFLALFSTAFSRNFALAKSPSPLAWNVLCVFWWPWFSSIAIHVYTFPHNFFWHKAILLILVLERPTQFSCKLSENLLHLLLI